MSFETLGKKKKQQNKWDLASNWARRSGSKQCSSVKEGKNNNQGGELPSSFIHPWAFDHQSTHCVVLLAQPTLSATTMRRVHGTPPSNRACELKGTMVFLAKSTNVYGKGRDMSWPVKQQLFLKTWCRRATGLEVEHCQALAWMKPLVSLLSLRTSIQNKTKLKSFSGPKQKASWTHCTWKMFLYWNNSLPHII